MPLVCKPKTTDLIRKCGNCEQLLSIDKFGLTGSKHRRTSCVRCSNLKASFKITGKEYDQMFKNQNGLCAICKKPEDALTNNGKIRRLAVDHNHSTGEIRGLLCTNCNCSIGALKESPDNIINSLNYLKGISSQINKVYQDSQLPTKIDNWAAGYDIYVHHIEETDNYVKVFTGIRLNPREGYYFELVSRSSTYKRGLLLANGIGIIDSNYRGEIIGIFQKTSNYKNDIKIGDRLLQLIPREQIWVTFEEVENLSLTERGNGAFGSSGK